MPTPCQGLTGPCFSGLGFSLLCLSLYLSPREFEGTEQNLSSQRSPWGCTLCQLHFCSNPWLYCPNKGTSVASRSSWCLCLFFSLNSVLLHSSWLDWNSGCRPIWPQIIEICLLQHPRNKGMYHHAWLSVFSDEAGGGVGEVVSVGWPQIPELKGVFLPWPPASLSL